MIPVYHPLTYTPSALMLLFARISHLPWAMLLSSGMTSHRDSRFDIMVAEPCITLVTNEQVTRIERGDQVSHSTQDPLLLLQQIIDEQPTIETSEKFPFQGGALGLFGYDLARQFEQLPATTQDDLQTPDMAVGIYNWALIADHQQETLTLICHEPSKQRLEWLLNLPETVSHAPFSLTSQWRSNMTRQQYMEKFAQVQEYILAGDCYQINLAQRFEARYEGDEWLAFMQLSQMNRAPFSAFLRLPESVILSLSPERFLSLNQQQIQTRPIKGTRPRMEEADADIHQAEQLKHSSKDRAENVMIVDLLRNDIGRVAETGSVHVPELFVVEKFPAVWHLVSTVTARLKHHLQSTDLLRACFPGGSITGAPKIRSMQIIEQLEPHRRNAWCGSIGYISCCGRMDTSITIRTLIAEQGKLYCAAGGGIVADSHPQAEYQETFDKVARILPSLSRLSPDITFQEKISARTDQSAKTASE